MVGVKWTRSGVVVPLVATAVAVAVLAPTGLPAIVAGLGLPLFALAARYRWGLLAHCGGLAIVFGVTLAAVGPTPVPYVLFATVAAVVAWDAATTDLVLQAQLTPAAATNRAAYVHTGATLAVGAVLAGGVFGLSRLVGDTVPGFVAVLAIGGAVALLLVLDPRPG